MKPQSQLPPLPPSFQEASARQKYVFGSLMAGSAAFCEIPSGSSRSERADFLRFHKTRQNSYRRSLLKALDMTPLPWYRPIPKRVYQRMRRQWLSSGVKFSKAESTLSTPGVDPRAIWPLRCSTPGAPVPLRSVPSL